MTLGTVAFLLVEVVIGMSPAHFEVCTRASGRPAIPGGGSRVILGGQGWA